MMYEVLELIYRQRLFSASGMIFRPVSVVDAASLFDAISVRAFHTDLPLSKLKTLGEAKKWCLERSLDWQTNACFVWTCLSENDLSLIGQVTLLPRSDNFALAYWVMPDRRGQGHATSMCREILKQVSKSGYKGNIWAGVHGWNDKSKAILLKLGFDPINTENSEIDEYSLTIT
ncbi:hypothetical protein GCM10007938_07810 [Vibrio zhanjiangensis]|uniref:N-acetyltransferase domain-containing protein n=1 Tax=Vibrio zhanjiangensis TaxID=1046128 RepID=A0ABQ6EVI7_9VIBR|nr:GNAT family N-acetyltransferase [Vibrio zhanjiangensis]GLT17004.1 hypothetical protein GCM10007938_07810 [Vibrio zhanjiangensis]